MYYDDDDHLCCPALVAMCHASPEVTNVPECVETVEWNIPLALPARSEIIFKKSSNLYCQLDLGVC